MGKFIEQLSQRFALAFAILGMAVEGIKSPAFAEFHDSSRPHHPVGALSVNQMADYVECIERTSTLVAADPFLGQVAQQCIEGGGSTGEKSDGVPQIRVHYGL
jgi:hypothetical protein